ncbi:MAG: hypothetical protein HRU25_06695 [Psychrobium sp.]|nr:hypothetical protein [Psychrobium sp.]
MSNSQRDKFFKKHVKEQKAALVSVNNRYPKFSFEFCCNSSRGIDKSCKETRRLVFEKILLLSKRTWHDIKSLPREQGFEMIDKSSFNSTPNIPTKFEKETKISVCRLPQSKGRVIGYVEEDTFYVVWVDTKFNMYSH